MKGRVIYDGPCGQIKEVSYLDFCAWILESASAAGFYIRPETLPYVPNELNMECRLEKHIQVSEPSWIELRFAKAYDLPTSLSCSSIKIHFPQSTAYEPTTASQVAENLQDVARFAALLDQEVRRVFVDTRSK